MRKRYYSNQEKNDDFDLRGYKENIHKRDNKNNVIMA